MRLPKKSSSTKRHGLSPTSVLLNEESTPGDQNLVDGTVGDGGIVIQGRSARIQITQVFENQEVNEKTKQADTTTVISVKHFEPETILIPAGPFWMGSPSDPGIPEYETPQHEIALPSYRIGKYPVTNGQFEEFIRQTSRFVDPVIGWDGQKLKRGSENHPVTGITWNEALAYCQWLAERTGRQYSLPNEAQWEKACRGKKQNLYPWGNKFDDQRCNHGRSSVSAVDAYPEQSQYGCFDLVGNVLQWTCSLWGRKRFPPEIEFRYPWKNDKRNDLHTNLEVRRVMRGSSYIQDVNYHRCSIRQGQLPNDRGLFGSRHSFRVVMLFE